MQNSDNNKNVLLAVLEAKVATIISCDHEDLDDKVEKIMETKFLLNVCNATSTEELSKAFQDYKNLTKVISNMTTDEKEEEEE